jgi:methionyl-tRNA synthetase
MEQMAPWNLLKDNRVDEMTAVLYNITQDIIRIAILLQVLCPHIAGKILDYFNLDNRKFDILYSEGNYIAKQKLAKPIGFFPRLKK